MKLRSLAVLAAALITTQAMADGRELSTKKIQELGSITGPELTSSDLIPVFDESARQVKKISAASFPGGAYDASAITASTTLVGNPLMQVTAGVITLASVNAGYTILTSVTGKTIYPGNWQLLASGAAAGATGVYLRCGGSNNVIASVPIVMLGDNIPVGPYKSSGAAGTATPILASAQVRGCASGDTVYISTTGTLTTTTHLYYMLPYTVQ